MMGILIFGSVSLPLTAFADGLLFKEQRASLEDKGVSFDGTALEDYVSVYKGGTIHKDTWLGRFDLGITLDTQKAGLYKGGKLHVSMMNAHGGLKTTADMIGDLQGVSNIEAPRSTRLYEAWYEQTIFDGIFSALAGLHDLNTEFAVSDSGALYINSAFGIMPCISANTGTSIYPMPAPGARIKFSPNEHVDVLAGVYDGDPGDPKINTHSTHLALKSQDGLFSIAEWALHYNLPLAGGLPGTVKAGGWYNSRDVNDVSAVDDRGDPVRHDDNYGGYAIIDQAIYKESEGQGLALFFMGGGAPQDRDTVQRHVGAGLNYTGLIPGRDADVLGAAFTSVQLSNKARAANGKRGETTLEWTYKININDNFAIQPDLQYVMDPSGDPTIKNASVFTLRTEIHF